MDYNSPYYRRPTRRNKRAQEDRRDFIRGLALILVALAIMSGWLAGALAVDCQQQRKALAGWCQLVGW